MEPINISYRVKLNEKVTEVFDFSLDGKTFELLTDKVENPPHWTALSFRQCSHCPLKVEEHPQCPLALQLHTIIERLHNTRSIDEVEVEVVSEERRVIQTTALQRIVASMFGLVFPTCGCPKSEHMRPMARFHLPLASEEETVFRVTGMYLLAQYFLHNIGKKGQFDFDGLIKIYEDLHILNTAMASRLQAATRSDSSLNAVTLLDMYATLVPMLLEDQLVEMRTFFGAFLPAGYADIKTTHNYLEKAKAFSLELLPIEEKVDDKADPLKQNIGFNKETLSAKEQLKTTVAKTEALKPATAKPLYVSPSLSRSKTSTGNEAEPIVPVVLEPLNFSMEPIVEKEPVVETPAAEKIEIKKPLFALPDDDLPPPKKPPVPIPPIESPPAEIPVTEKKKSLFALPDDEPPPKPATPDKKNEEGGLMLVDYEP